MKSTTKRRLLNAAMIAAIAVVLAAALLIVGTLQGWFAQKTDAAKTDDDSAAVLTVENKAGSVNIERGGISYSLKEGNALRIGDVIETLNGASIDVVCGESRLTLCENSSLKITEDENGAVFELLNGGLFADTSDLITLRIHDSEISLESGAFSASAPFGSACLYVYGGRAAVNGSPVEAGSRADMTAGEITVKPLELASLNAFELEKVAALSETEELCFKKADIEANEAQREQEKQDALDAKLLEEETSQTIEEERRQNEQQAAQGGQTATPEPSGDRPQATPAPSDKPSAAPEDTSLYCTITIRCDTILDHMDELKEGKNRFVPANGCILAVSKLKFEEGESAFDVLKRACTLAGIQLEYSWTPMYNSYYIEGINNLYEFDCGSESGWVYRVNGWVPNYGCSVYKIKEGDAISFNYTCRGFGDDVS